MNQHKYIKVLLAERDDLGEVDIIEGPAEVLNLLKQYRQDFYEYAEKNYYGAWEDYDITEGFVEYLNNVILKDSYHKVKLIASQTKEYDSTCKRYIL